MNRAILIPVKMLSRAKRRLASLLSQRERFRLAEAMMLDVFAAVAGIRPPVRVFVVSSCPIAIARAQSRGWEVLPEARQISESESVDNASRLIEAKGVTSLLRLPIDIPLLQPSDIEEILEKAEPRPSCVMVPSRDGTGTNALLRTPPTLFASQFGPDSLQKHLSAARNAGAHIHTVKNSQIALDVDDAADLVALLRQTAIGQFTTAWLKQNFAWLNDRLFASTVSPLGECSDTTPTRRVGAS